jgi:hypothetical protein
VRPTNIVPTRATRTIAGAMVYDARVLGAPDAVLKHLGDLPRDQYAALLSVLIEPAPRSGLGQPLMPTVLSAAERLRGRSQYVQGIRNDFTRLANREYHRVQTRLARARQERAEAS